MIFGDYIVREKNFFQTGSISIFFVFWIFFEKSFFKKNKKSSKKKCFRFKVMPKKFQKKVFFWKFFCFTSKNPGVFDRAQFFYFFWKNFFQTGSISIFFVFWIFFEKSFFKKNKKSSKKKCFFENFSVLLQKPWSFWQGSIFFVFIFFYFFLFFFYF